MEHQWHIRFLWRGDSSNFLLVVGLNASVPIAGLKARGSPSGDYSFAVASNARAVVAPKAVVEEEHAIVRDASCFAEKREMRPRLVLRKGRGATYLHIPFEKTAIITNGPTSRENCLSNASNELECEWVTKLLVTFSHRYTGKNF